MNDSRSASAEAAIGETPELVGLNVRFRPRCLGVVPTILSISDGEEVIAFNRQETDRRWTASTGGSRPTTPVAVGDDHVFTRTFNGTLFAFDRSNGDRVWRQSEGNASFELLVHDGAVITTTGDGTLFAAEAASGTDRWRVTPEEGHPLVGVLGAHNDRIFLAERVNGKTAIRARDVQTGEPVWTSPIKDNVVKPRGPAIADGTVYVTGKVPGERPLKVYVAALDEANGKLRWQHQLKPGQWLPIQLDNSVRMVVTVLGPTVVDDTVYVTGGGRVFEIA